MSLIAIWTLPSEYLPMMDWRTMSVRSPWRLSLKSFIKTTAAMDSMRFVLEDMSQQLVHGRAMFPHPAILSPTKESLDLRELPRMYTFSSNPLNLCPSFIPLKQAERQSWNTTIRPASSLYEDDVILVSPFVYVFISIDSEDSISKRMGNKGLGIFVLSS